MDKLLAWDAAKSHVAVREAGSGVTPEGRNRKKERLEWSGNLDAWVVSGTGGRGAIPMSSSASTSVPCNPHVHLTMVARVRVREVLS